MDNSSTEIIELINKYLSAYLEKRNFEEVQLLFASGFTCIGTGLHEFSVTKEQALELFKNDINNLKEPIHYTDFEIHLCDVKEPFATAIFTFTIQTEIDESILYLPNIRNSLGLIIENGGWKIWQLHVSVPNDQQNTNEIYPLQRMIEKNELLEKIVEERTKELSISNDLLIESNKTKDKLFSIISHDIKSPFNSLLGFAELLKSDFDDFSDTKKKIFIKHISDNSKQIYTLIDNLLIWSRIQGGQFQFQASNQSLYELAQNALDVLMPIAMEKQIRIINEINPLTNVLADTFMIATVFRNLISNAIKFTHNNGEIIIYEEEFIDDEKYIKIGVQDQGVGMTQQQLDALFSSSNIQSTHGTANEKGSGLGLSLCKGLIEYHQTKIWAESKKGAGTKIFFLLQSKD